MVLLKRFAASCPTQTRLRGDAVAGVRAAILLWDRTGAAGCSPGPGGVAGVNQTMVAAFIESNSAVGCAVAENVVRPLKLIHKGTVSCAVTTAPAGTVAGGPSEQWAVGCQHIPQRSACHGRDVCDILPAAA